MIEGTMSTDGTSTGILRSAMEMVMQSGGMETILPLTAPYFSRMVASSFPRILNLLTYNWNKHNA